MAYEKFFGVLSIFPDKYVCYLLKKTQSLNNYIQMLLDLERFA